MPLDAQRTGRSIALSTFNISARWGYVLKVLLLSTTVNTDKQNLPWGGEHLNALAASASLCCHSFKSKFGTHFKNVVTLMFLIIIFFV
jgi:hypothetical protein